MYTNEDIINIAQLLGVTFDKFTQEDLLTGVATEMEHGLVNPQTNITNNDIIMTMKIALAHLNEFPNYYNKEYGLPAFEQSLKMRRAFY